MRSRNFPSDFRSVAFEFASFLGKKVTLRNSLSLFITISRTGPPLSLALFLFHARARTHTHARDRDAKNNAAA
jgi:hypothetical protein